MSAELIARLNKGALSDNEFDVLWEAAHFEPDGEYRAARANFAGTKVIYTLADGSERTHWAPDYTKAIRAAQHQS